MSEYTGAACPACGSEEIIGDEGPEIDGPHAWQEMSCLQCNATWIDTYELTGFMNLEIESGDGRQRIEIPNDIDGE